MDAVARIELIHHVNTLITVSSLVQNAAIKPADLVDGDLATAWNSRTGDVIGAWIYVEVAPAHVDQIRMTAGHTGKGAHGEDYFTMNVRVREVAVLDGARVVAKAKLDVERRDLQSIDLPAPLDAFTIRIDDVVPGTKPDWREVCVSELEAWGSARANIVGDYIPLVEVAKPLPARPERLCDEFADDIREHDQLVRADLAGNLGNAGCNVDTTATKLGAPWRGVGVRCYTHDAHYEGTACVLAFDTGAGWWLGAEVAPAQLGAVIATGNEVVVHLLNTRGEGGSSVTCNANHTCEPPKPE